jgi:Beta-1,3-glucanase
MSLMKQVSLVGRTAAAPLPNRCQKLWRALWRGLSLAGFIACTWLPISAFAQDNAGLPTIPLDIVNSFGSSGDLYVLIYGQIDKNSKGIPVGAFVYVTDTAGDVAITPAIPGNAARSLSLNGGTGTPVDLTLPKLAAVRIYYSIGAPLLVHTGNIEGGGIVTPTVQNPSDPNFNTIFDFTELTWVPQTVDGHPEITTNLGLNVTEVDAFGLPQQFTIEGTDPATLKPNTALTGGFLSTVKRATLLATLKGFGTPWDGLIVGTAGTQPARALAPNLAIQGGFFPGDQLDDYINKVFTTYMASPPLTATVSAALNMSCPSVTYNFTGATAGGELVFSDAKKGGPIFSLIKWSTLDAYAGSFQFGAVVPTNTCDRPDKIAALAVEADLQAALMRTTLLVHPDLTNDPAHCPSPTAYYTNAPVNMYAQLWHQNGINGKAYAFGFDDVCSQSSFQLIFNPTKLTVALLGG